MLLMTLTVGFNLQPFMLNKETSSRMSCHMVAAACNSRANKRLLAFRTHRSDREERRVMLHIHDDNRRITMRTQARRSTPAVSA
uniref:Secreted protein n=1 Tax=Steinernema glaseri TaxID=37863 RepID=A0A1I7Y144_9BILA